MNWLNELHEEEDFEKRPIEEWATEENLEIKGFDYSRAASFYPLIYNRRFNKFKEEGYAFLEDVMDHAEPSFGYSVLAQIMANTPHQVAITTNFDNLIADAISIYTRKSPLVCGHESLTGYIRPDRLRRPLIAKIHRDLLLAPLSNPEETAKLPEEWAAALTRIFYRFTPIVIGYGGNDGSLMGFLKKLSPIEGGVFWCYREADEIDPAIDEVVEHHRGDLVPIAGFDEVMLMLKGKLNLPTLDQDLKNVQEKRIVDYVKQLEALNAELSKPLANEAAEKAREPARKAAEAAVERLTKEKTWWAWELKAKTEPDLARREAIYRDGIEDFPASAELTGNFALFLHDVTKNYDEAERVYRKALKLDPNNSVVTGNFAMFMHEVRKNYDEAERLYRKALELDPNNASATRNFALFMHDVRKNYDEAERLYRKALELDPNFAVAMGDFALFMKDVRKNYDEAERLYRKALELDPNFALATGNFALFMKDVRKDYDEAERLYRKALELDPNNASATRNFALFMQDVRKNYDEAERLYRKALDLDPNFAVATGDFALFMQEVTKDYDEAERLYRKALELDPSNAVATRNFALFMKDVRKNYDEAERLYRRADLLDAV